MKKVEEIIFDDTILEDYKNEIEEINQTFEELEKCKSLQNIYKRYMKNNHKSSCKYNDVNKNPIFSKPKFLKNISGSINTIYLDSDAYKAKFN